MDKYVAILIIDGRAKQGRRSKTFAGAAEKALEMITKNIPDRRGMIGREEWMAEARKSVYDFGEFTWQHGECCVYVVPMTD